MRKIKSIVTLIMCVVMTTVSSLSVSAGVFTEMYEVTNNGDIYATGQECLYHDVDHVGKVNKTRFYAPAEKKTKSSVSTTNPKVVTVKTSKPYKGYQDIYYYVHSIGNGNATIKVNNKDILKVFVNKYNSPCKSFKIGKTEYASKFKSSPIYFIKLGKNKTKSGKISVEPASGWSFVKIMKITGSNNYKRIKNGASLTLTGYGVKDNGIIHVSGKTYAVFAVFKNIKTKQYSSVIVYSGKKAVDYDELEFD